MLKLDAREAYALWADTYVPWPHNPIMETEQAVVAPLIASTAPQRALDVGTGTGRYLPLLASTGARIVVGLDFSMEMLRAHVRLKPDATGTRTKHIICGDARRLPFRAAGFDLVSSSLMVGDVDDLAPWIREIARVLTPGGHLIYSDFHPSWATEQWRRTFQAADGRSHEIVYFPHTIADHTRLLDEAGFDVVTIREPRLTSTRGVPPSHRDLPVVVVFHAVKRPAPWRSGQPAVT